MTRIITFLLLLLWTTTPTQAFAPKEALPQDEPATKQQSIEQLITRYSLEYGVNTQTALKIAYCESGVKQFEANGQLLRGRVVSADVGVFQVNEGYHLDTSKRMGFDVHTTEGNIEYSMWLMKNEGVHHWNASRYCWGKD